MFKLLPLLLLAPLATASSDEVRAKVALVQQLYNEARANPEEDFNLLLQRADDDFRATFEAIPEDDYCISFSPVWSSQDPDYNAPINVRPLSNGKVRAWLAPTVMVDYTLRCGPAGCQIVDVENYPPECPTGLCPPSSAQSLKQTMQECAAH